MPFARERPFVCLPSRAIFLMVSLWSWLSSCPSVWLSFGVLTRSTESYVRTLDGLWCWGRINRNSTSKTWTSWRPLRWSFSPTPSAICLAQLSTLSSWWTSSMKSPFGWISHLSCSFCWTRPTTLWSMASSTGSTDSPSGGYFRALQLASRVFRWEKGKHNGGLVVTRQHFWKSCDRDYHWRGFHRS